MVVAVFVVETVTFAVSTAFASASAFSRKVIMKKPPPDCSGRRFLSLGNEKRFALFELFLLSFVPVAHRAEVAADAAVDFAGLAAGAHLAASAVVGAEVDPTSVTGAIPSFMSSDFLELRRVVAGPAQALDFGHVIRVVPGRSFGLFIVHIVFQFLPGFLGDRDGTDLADDGDLLSGGAAVGGGVAGLDLPNIDQGRGVDRLVSEVVGNLLCGFGELGAPGEREKRRQSDDER